MNEPDDRTFLGELGQGDREAVMACARRRTIPRGTAFLFEGDHSSEVFVIVSGQAKVVVTAKDGREVLLAIRAHGDIVGELAALDETPRSATVSAIEDCEVLVISAGAFRELIDTRPGIARFLLFSMAARMRQTSVRQLEFGVDDALSRVCRRLIEMAERYGVATDNGLVVDAPLSQQDMASWSGLSRQAVVKALTALRSLRWIETTGRQFVIRDERAVRDRAAVTSGDM